MAETSELAVQEPQQDEDEVKGGGEVVSVDLKDASGNTVMLNIANALEFFSKPKGLEPFLERIRLDALSLVEALDISSEAGRKGIASVAYRVSRSKVAVDKIRKRLTADQKAQLAKIDAEGKRFCDECDKIRDTVRQPLDEYEDAEKLRIQTHEGNLRNIESQLVFYGEPTIEEIEQRLAWVAEGVSEGGEVFGWQEFAARAQKTIAVVTETLTNKLAELKQREAEIAEALRLRAVEEEERRLAREEQIKNEAAARARAETEARARDEARALAAKVKADADRAESERRSLEASARRSADMAAKAEADRLAAAAKAARDAEEAEARHKRELAEVEERERKRVAADQVVAARAQIDADRRKEQKKHREKVHRDAAKAIADLWPDITSERDEISDHDAIALVEAIADGKIRNISINY